MNLKLKLSHQAFIAVAITLLCEMIFGGALIWMVHDAEAQVQQSNYVRTVISHLTKLSNTVQNCAMGLMQCVILSDPKDAKSGLQQGLYLPFLSQINEETSTLKELMRDHPEELYAIRDLEQTCAAAYPLIGKVMDTYMKEEREAHKQCLLQLKSISDSLTRQVGQILDTYKQMEERGLERQEHTRQAIKIWIILGIIANLFLVLALVLYFIRNITGRLSILEDNSLRLAAGKPLHAALSGNDEISVVDHSFHSMAEALEESKRKERAVTDNAFDVICSIDKDGRFTAMNPASLRLFGIQPDELIGTRYGELFPYSEREHANRAFMDALKKESASSFETVFQRVDGAKLDFLWSAQWSPREKSLFCVVHDITERKEVDRLRREFVAMISHDLRTPLMSVEFSLSLLSVGALGELTEKARSNVKDAENNLSYVMTLINSLLDMERLSAGKLEIRCAPVQISSIIRRAIEAVQPIAQNHAMTVTAQIDDVELNADEGRLLQVLINLLSNALKYSPDKTNVVVSCSHTAGHIEVRVKDEGPGIPLELRGKVFEQFERIETQTGKSESTGLGLAICKAIVEQHKGTIGVTGGDGKGSVFWFRLPRDYKG